MVYRLFKRSKTSWIEFCAEIKENKEEGGVEGEDTYVHANTSDAWPAVTLSLVFVVGSAGLQDWFVNTATTSDDTCCDEMGSEGLSEMERDGTGQAGE